jgi:hypothetical protein
MGQLFAKRLQDRFQIGSVCGSLFRTQRKPFLNADGSVPQASLLTIAVGALVTGNVVTVAVAGYAVSYTVPAVVPTSAQLAAALVNLLRGNGFIGSLVNITTPSAVTIGLTGRNQPGSNAGFSVTTNNAAVVAITQTAAAANGSTIPYGRFVSAVAGSAAFIPNAQGQNIVRVYGAATDIILGVSVAQLNYERILDASGVYVAGVASGSPLEVLQRGEIIVETDTPIVFTGAAQPAFAIRHTAAGSLTRKGALTLPGAGAYTVLATDPIKLIGSSIQTDTDTWATRVSVDIAY